MEIGERSKLGEALWYALITITLVLTWKAVKLVWIKPKNMESCFRKQGIKGNSYRLIIGDVREMIKSIKASFSTPISLSEDYIPRVLSFLHQNIQKHGGNSFMWVGPTPWLIVTDPEKIKEILIRYEEFQKPNHPLAQSLLVGLFGLEGDQWAKHRKIINPAFHVDKLKSMYDALDQSCSTMLSAWEEIVSREGSTELDVKPFLLNLTGDAISRAAFGSSYEQGNRIFDLQTEHIDLSMGFQLSNHILGWRYLPTKKNQRAKQICREMDELLTRMINSRKKEIEANRSSTRQDLLGILLESNIREIKEHENQNNKGLTTAEVVEECKLFYLAGSETTSTLLVWTLVLLSKHHMWQERARAEVLQLFGKDQKPTIEGLNRAKVVSMILYEVLRLYSPAHALMRKVYTEVRLREWLIPAGTEILMPICIVHQDFDIWGPDAKEFNPERFAEGVSNAAKGKGVFFPFSAGPRICIGQNFALLEAKLALTMILQRFSFKLSPNYTHAPYPLLTMRPQYGAELILHKL